MKRTVQPSSVEPITWEDEETDEEYQARRAARRRRIEERRRKQRKAMIYRRIVAVFVFLLFAGIVALSVKSMHKSGEEEVANVADLEEAEGGIEMIRVDAEGNPIDPPEEEVQEAQDPVMAAPGGVLTAQLSATPQAIPGEVVSSYVCFVDLAHNEVIANREMNARMVPASMTKVLTLLVATEHLTEANLSDEVTITIDITDYTYSNDCSVVGFAQDETVPVKDLLYGTILPSGADAALALANYVAGDQEHFVELMNQKLAELGLNDTAHFTNCIGTYNDNHYCTAYDMAVIMKAAMDNPLCREVLSTHVYTTTATEQHPEGITISNWFLRRIEDKDCGGTVVGGKTGYVVQSGSCAVSFGTDGNGAEYICVTGGSTSSWRCIYDHVALYKAYTVGAADTEATEAQETAE
ncbi:MAG: serine hydrolase [Lachnospiraceae bacterium]|nr:serine hydrolase [Lachnospiraceae bacterium]